MADHRNVDIMTRNAVPVRLHVYTTAIPTLSVVPTGDLQLDPTVYDDLYDAALSPTPKDAIQAVKDALAKGISADDISDLYVPELARRLGEAWCVDQLSFALVTIGASRLQTMLRALGPSWSGDNGSSPDAPSLLLVVLQDVHHTLGAIVLGGQLRRKGYSVKLLLGGKPLDIAENIARTRYKAVFISSSLGETLESLRGIVDIIRAAAKTRLPVVIGGTILEAETIETIMARTGADFATKIPDEALGFCGLRIMTHTNAQVLRRT